MRKYKKWPFLNSLSKLLKYILFLRFDVYCMNWSVILSLGKVLFVGRVNNGNLVIIDIEKGIKIIGCDSSCNKP